MTITNREAKALLKARPDHRAELSKLLRHELAAHGLTRKGLTFDKLNHVFDHGYHKSEQLLCVRGAMYCPELWSILGSPHMAKHPIYSYTVGNYLEMKDWIIYLDEELDIPKIEAHFRFLTENAILQIVKSVQNPKEAVKFAIEHRILMPASKEYKDQRLKTWANHYGLIFIPPA